MASPENTRFESLNLKYAGSECTLPFETFFLEL
jgi:hypothetical protein